MQPLRLRGVSRLAFQPLDIYFLNIMLGEKI